MNSGKSPLPKYLPILRLKKGITTISMAMFISTLIAIIEKKLNQLTHPPREEIAYLPKDDLNYKNLEIDTTDGKVVSGWLFQPEKKTDKVVIVSHGYGKNRISHPAILQLVGHFINNGIAVILYDFENHGLLKGEKTSSDGRTTIGIKTEKNDLHAVINYAKKEFDFKNIGLMGASMGAATSLMVAAERDDIQMAVADSSFSSLKEYLIEQITEWDDKLKPWMIKLLLKYARILKGLDVNQSRPIDAVEELGKRGVLVRFFHTNGDRITPKKHSDLLADAYCNAYNQAHGDKQPLTPEDVLMLTESYSEKFQCEDITQLDHCRSIDVDFDGYRKFAIDWMIENLGKIKPKPRLTPHSPKKRNPVALALERVKQIKRFPFPIIQKNEPTINRSH